MIKNWKKFWRQLHYWLSITIALQFPLLLGTGTLLLLKKEFTWIQPATQRGNGNAPTISFEKILETVQSIPEAQITGYHDIDRLDIRPGKGMLKVRANNQYEIQLDAATGEVLQIAYRRTDIIEALHDGTFFHERVKLWILLPSAVIMLILWATGIYLFIIPFMVKAKKRRKIRPATTPDRPTLP